MADKKVSSVKEEPEVPENGKSKQFRYRESTICHFDIRHFSFTLNCYPNLKSVTKTDVF